MITILLAAAAPLAFENLDELDTRVAHLLASRGEAVRAIPLDRRLKLRKCPVEPVIDPGVAPAITLRCDAVGWRVAVAMERVTKQATTPAVRKGDPVVFVAAGEGFEVSTAATATSDAGVGEPARVKTLTGRLLAGRATPAGEVRVGD